VSPVLLSLLQELSVGDDEAVVRIEKSIATELQSIASGSHNLTSLDLPWQAMILKLHQVLLLPRVLDVLCRTIRALFPSHRDESVVTHVVTVETAQVAQDIPIEANALNHAELADIHHLARLHDTNSIERSDGEVDVTTRHMNLAQSFTSLQVGDEPRETSWSKLEAQQQKLRQHRMEEVATAAVAAEELRDVALLTAAARTTTGTSASAATSTVVSPTLSAVATSPSSSTASSTPLPTPISLSATPSATPSATVAPTTTAAIATASSLLLPVVPDTPPVQRTFGSPTVPSILEGRLNDSYAR
jgi:hypothetical protein